MAVWDDPLATDPNPRGAAYGELACLFGRPRPRGGIWKTLTDAAAPDVNPPVVANLSPAPGTIPGGLPAAINTPIQFDVIDEAAEEPELRTVIVTVRIRDGSENPPTLVVHNGGEFLHPFVTRSTRTGDAEEGYHYSILPDGGWYGDLLALDIYAIDIAGNQMIDDEVGG